MGNAIETRRSGRERAVVARSSLLLRCFLAAGLLCIAVEKESAACLMLAFAPARAARSNTDDLLGRTPESDLPARRSSQRFLGVSTRVREAARSLSSRPDLSSQLALHMYQRAATPRRESESGLRLGAESELRSGPPPWRRRSHRSATERAFQFEPGAVLYGQAQVLSRSVQRGAEGT